MHRNTSPNQEAVAVAVEACADDTKGQTCYICTQALHWKTKEGLVRGCSCRGTAGFAHVSCLAEQAKILYAEAEENNLGDKVLNQRLERWYSCSLCEQIYHGVVRCAFGWACWKTYLGRPETDRARLNAMNVLGLGLSDSYQHAAALTVQEAELATMRRLGEEEGILVAQSNLANSYATMGRLEQASQMERDIYRGRLKLNGEEHEMTLLAALNSAATLVELKRFEEAKSRYRKTIPVARRVLGEGHDVTFRMRKGYARALCEDASATLNDVREAVTTLEETERTARRVMGRAHPLTTAIEHDLRHSRAILRAREAPPTSG